MPTYTIQYVPRVLKELRRLPPVVRDRLVAEVRLLASEPRPHHSRKLVGFAHTYRIRVGDYRVIYEIHEAARIVYVTQAGHRKEVYR